MKKFTWLYVVATALTVVLVASAAARPTALSQRVLLGDYSLDTTPAQRNEAIRALNQMADLAAADRGMVAAAPFQSSALATIAWPVNHTFTPKASDPNSYYTKIDLQQQAEAVKQQARKLFGRQRRTQG